MTLGQKQRIYSKLIAELILRMYAQGYEVALGEFWRSPEEAERLANADKGIKNSLHTVKLAGDLNLFKNGKYLTKTEDHRPFGEYWESLSTPEYTCTWGGRFGDGNHYSISHLRKK